MVTRESMRDEYLSESARKTQEAVQLLLTQMKKADLARLLFQHGAAKGDNSGNNMIRRFLRGGQRRPTEAAVTALKAILRERGLPPVLGEEEDSVLVFAGGAWVRFNPFRDLGQHRVGAVLRIRMEGQEYRARVVKGEGGKALEPIMEPGKD